MYKLLNLGEGKYCPVWWGPWEDHTWGARGLPFFNADGDVGLAIFTLLTVKGREQEKWKSMGFFLQNSL